MTMLTFFLAGQSIHLTGGVSWETKATWFKEHKDVRAIMSFNILLISRLRNTETNVSNPFYPILIVLDAWDRTVDILTCLAAINLLVGYISGTREMDITQSMSSLLLTWLLLDETSVRLFMKAIKWVEIGISFFMHLA